MQESFEFLGGVEVRFVMHRRLLLHFYIKINGDYFSGKMTKSQHKFSSTENLHWLDAGS